MSREALQESLSAVMDNEADELELRRVLNAFDDVETRETWARYQIARAVMHKDLLIPVWTWLRPFRKRWLMKPCQRKSAVDRGVAWAAWPLQHP